MDISFWEKYWQDKEDGGHRYKSEQFYKKQAKEKLYHMTCKNSEMLDIGCGSADLLVYYAPYFQKIYGVDFSENMIKNAQRRAENFSVKNIEFFIDNHRDIWNKFDFKFDLITSGQMIQYLDEVEARNFVDKALDNLKDKGELIIFDVIDPRIHKLWELKLFVNHQVPISTVLIRLFKLMIKKFINKVKRLPENIKGNSFYPVFFENILGDRKEDLTIEFVSSMYYEYRYHVIIRKNNEGLNSDRV